MTSPEHADLLAPGGDDSAQLAVGGLEASRFEVDQSGAIEAGKRARGMGDGNAGGFGVSCRLDA